MGNAPGRHNDTESLIEGLIRVFSTTKISRRKAGATTAKGLALLFAADAVDVMAQQERSGFSLSIEALRSDRNKLSPEFGKLGINAEFFDSMLTKLESSEQVMMKETKTTLEKIFASLGTTFKNLGPNDKRRAAMGNAGLGIKSLLGKDDTPGTLIEDFNLIKAMRLIIELKKSYPGETNLISTAYFEGILKYIDDILKKLIKNIQDSKGKFGVEVSNELTEFSNFLGTLMGNKVENIPTGANKFTNAEFKMRGDEVIDWERSSKDEKVVKLSSKKGEFTIHLTPDKQGKGHFYVKQTVKLKQGTYALNLPVISESTPGIALVEIINSTNDQKTRAKKQDGILSSELEIKKPMEEVTFLIYLSLSDVKKGALPAGPAEVKYGPIQLSEKSK